MLKFLDKPDIVFDFFFVSLNLWNCRNLLRSPLSIYTDLGGGSSGVGKGHQLLFARVCELEIQFTGVPRNTLILDPLLSPKYGWHNSIQARTIVQLVFHRGNAITPSPRRLTLFWRPSAPIREMIVKNDFLNQYLPSAVLGIFFSFFLLQKSLVFWLR